MSLYQRGKSWYYDFQHRGQRYTGCIGVVSKTVAKEIYAKKKAEAIEGRYKLPSRKPSPLFEDMAIEYLEYYKANRRPRSVERHEMAYKAIKPVFAGKRLADINPFLIEKFKRIRKEHGRSEVTINRELAFLKNLYTMAITWGKATENPVSKVKFFREDNGRTRYLTDEEEARLLKQCDAHLKPIVITALHTGFRKSELLSLTWNNVNFRQRVISVEAAYVKNHEARSVPMTNRLTETLQVLRDKEDPAAAVFLTRKRTPYRHISKIFTRACERAGLTDVTFHDLRHTFASRLVMRGVDLPTVKELMGHKRIEMTLRYSHLAPEHKRSAITVLDQISEKVPRISTAPRQEATESSL